ncbi:MAG: amidohydrolase [Treponema sp.]|nr:amidohydrolase [Treponema sp.]
MNKYYGDFEITDAHVHPFGGAGLEKFFAAAKDFIDDVQVKGVNLLCINNSRFGSPGTDLLALALKLHDPRFTAYSAFGYWMNTIGHDSSGLLSQLETYMAAGFDGLKMLEGKPTERSISGIPLDDPRYDRAFDLLEKTGLHVLSHVNDPEEFWDREKCPKWANEGKGGYWDASKFLSKEQHYRENENMLARHPKINITFAHAYFLSNFPDRMTALLDRFPNVTVDLTPGIEMYDGFTRQHKRWQEIFNEYQDRFLFGTDNAVNPLGKSPITHDGSSRYKVENIARFLTTSDEFEAWGYSLKGLGLPKEVSAKILSGNYLRLRGQPRPVNRDAAISYGESLLKEVTGRKDIGDAIKRDITEALGAFS